MAAIHHFSSDSAAISDATLPPMQAQVVAALAQGQTITAAARDAGIHRATIHHWLRNEPDFKTAVENAQCEYSGALSDEMRDLSALALATPPQSARRPDHPALDSPESLPRRPPAPEIPEPKLDSPRAHRIAPTSAGSQRLGGSRSRLQGHANDGSRRISRCQSRMRPQTQTEPAPEPSGPQRPTANTQHPPFRPSTRLPVARPCPCGFRPKIPQTMLRQPGSSCAVSPFQYRSRGIIHEGRQRNTRKAQRSAPNIVL